MESVANLVMMLPGYFEDTMNMIDKLLRSGTIPKEILDSIGVYAAQIQDTLIKILRNGVPQLISMAGWLCQWSCQYWDGFGNRCLLNNIQR